MIQNWEIISQIDTKTKAIRYSLVIDGTQKDARIIAKKLKGYVKEMYAADIPYTHGFVLPSDLDENTQEKIRTAVQEGVELSRKVDSLVPGGTLGDPLFNSVNTASGFPSFSSENSTLTSLADRQIDLNTSPNNVAQSQAPGSPQKPTAPTQEPPTSSLDTSHTAQPPAEVEEVNPLNLQKQTIDVTQDKTQYPGTLSISDGDMLIDGMEGSVLEKMPIEDILSAETRYDMFVDVNQTSQQVAQTQQNKAQKIPSAQPPNTASFNVFEHELKDQTNIIDIEDVQTITDRLAQKDKTFMDNTNSSQEKGKTAPAAPANTKETPHVPFTLGAAQEEPLTNKEEQLKDTLPPQADFSRADLPAITIREDISDVDMGQEDSDQLDQTFNLETTFNTEFIKKQNEKIRSLREGTPMPEEQEPPKTKTILRLKKQPPQAPVKKEDQPGKTILRLRRKNNIPDAPSPSAAKPLRSTVSPTHAAAKQGGSIDHSIQIPTSELKKHNWPLEVPLVPTYTLNNMVMSVNRFAHATAISVIENPGKLYNPLVLHGGTGTGKTHFLNALAYAFSKKFGQEHIFMTNGVRLSRGIQRYVMEGNIDKFENFMKSVQVLLIDDIHLLAINEQNRAYVSKLLNGFLEEKKQIVITSKYPPESLEKLEELIQFKLDSGWISELKPATGSTHFRIVKKMLFENGVDLSDKQIEEFFGAPHMTLGTVTRSIRRLKVLENLIFPNLPAEQKSQADIFEKLLATKGEDSSSEILNKDPADVTTLNMMGNGEWGRIGIFYPQNCSEMMSWMVYALEQRAKELGIEGGFEIVVRSSYATENIISSAFKIANLCDNKKLKGAVILGPQPGSCDPSVRENFYDILTHMLEIMLIRCGIINYENVRLPSTYVKVISELMR